MKTWRLVSGIISIILTFFVMFQSCAAGFVNTIEANGDVSGSAGVIVSLMLLSGGIVSIATRRGGRGGLIATVVLYGIGTLVGFLLAGDFSDLIIWSLWCMINAGIAFFAILKDL